MFRLRKWIQEQVLIILILILILICPGPVHTSAEVFSADDKVPIYKIPIPEKMQRDIWKQCEKNNLSYELVLAIFQVDGINDAQPQDINSAIQELIDDRNYWTGQGYPDEMVFDLIILSRQTGIESSKILLNDSGSYENDAYVQKVTAYKYDLDQLQ
ncbi:MULTISPECIES: hypothetical protein [unclassified Dehalobacter]|uniref:hypothetical protein n=1 Tax=unclassified Dehalobacter TaxID=2635733 RepID=UPI001FA9E079|nr:MULTISPECIES: hypothetical protein [unclassified Dehalobacter]